MKIQLGLTLIALSAVAVAETANLWNGAPVPRAAELERLEGVEFSVIKKHEPEQDGYDWLHGVALCWHKGRLWASYGTNRGKENTPTEEAHVRVSDDGGKTWGTVKVVAKGENGQGLATARWRHTTASSGASPPRSRTNARTRGRTRSRLTRHTGAGLRTGR